MNNVNGNDNGNGVFARAGGVVEKVKQAAGGVAGKAKQAAGNARQAAGGVAGNVGQIAGNVRRIVWNVVQMAVGNAAARAKAATKRIILGLLIKWAVWLVLSILLIIIIGGLISALLVFFSFIGMVVYSIVSCVVKVKAASVKIAMVIPIDITNGILTQIAIINPAITENMILNEIYAVVQNPRQLLSNPWIVTQLINNLTQFIANPLVQQGDNGEIYAENTQPLEGQEYNYNT